VKGYNETTRCRAFPVGHTHVALSSISKRLAGGDLRGVRRHIFACHFPGAKLRSLWPCAGGDMDHRRDHHVDLLRGLRICFVARIDARPGRRCRCCATGCLANNRVYRCRHLSMSHIKTLGLCVVGVLVICLGFLAWFLIDRVCAARRAPEGWKQVRVGMNVQEVAALLGYPPTTSTMTFGPNALGQFRTNEQWYYAFGKTGQAVYSGRYVVTFTNGFCKSTEIR
jgi:hypothetical protein